MTFVVMEIQVHNQHLFVTHIFMGNAKLDSPFFHLNV